MVRRSHLRALARPHAGIPVCSPARSQASGQDGWPEQLAALREDVRDLEAVMDELLTTLHERIDAIERCSPRDSRDLERASPEPGCS